MSESAAETRKLVPINPRSRLGLYVTMKPVTTELELLGMVTGSTTGLVSASVCRPIAVRGRGYMRMHHDWCIPVHSSGS